MHLLCSTSRVSDLLMDGIGHPMVKARSRTCLAPQQSAARPWARRWAKDRPHIGYDSVVSCRPCRTESGTVSGARSPHSHPLVSSRIPMADRSPIGYRAQFRSGGWRVNGQEVALGEDALGDEDGVEGLR